MREKEKAKYFFSVAGFSLALLVLGAGKLNGVAPFSSALMYALILRGYAFTPVVGFAAGEVIFCGSLSRFAVSMAALSPAILLSVVGRIRKKPNSFAVKCAVFAFHTVARLIGYTPLSPLFLTVSALVTACFTYVFFHTLGFIRAFERYAVTDTSVACASLTLVAFGSGLGAIEFYGVPLLVAAAGFIVLGANIVYGRGASLTSAFSLGAGYAFINFDVKYMALFGFCALSGGFFSSSRKVFAFCASLMAMAIYFLYFSSSSDLLGAHLLFYFFGQLAFVLLPNGTTEGLRAGKYASSGGVAIRYLINKNRFETARKLGSLKDVFSHMSDVLLYFKTDPSAVYAALARKVESDVCAKCDKYSECKRKGLSSALFQLSRATLIKNKAAVSSLPPLIDKECKHLATIVGSTYNRSLETRKDILEIRTQNKIRSSLSGTLSGIKDILEQERKNVAVAVGFDFAREEAIREELAAAGVFCSSALVSMEENFSVILLVRADAYSKAECEAAVSRVLKVRCAVKREDNSVIRGWSVITLTEKPVFAAVIGVAQKPKTVGSTGDSHSFEKIDDKIMCALCDGMGSGEKAAETSDKALSLIEDFYRAGFDHNLTVRSVNSFLKVDSQDTFSALDVLVFDTRTGVADVVKLASPPSFVKKSEVVVRLDSSSLPLGIVGEITPSITTRQVEDGDVFVLVSDGVADCFDGDALSGVINNADGRNPQKLAEYVLGEAIRRKTKDKEDDMTVLTCGIFCDR